ncbi:class I SAM-dependent methyltransferase [Sinorhizobium meliloti]
MELRAADPRSRAIREKFFASVDFPEAARVLEIGCGSGAISRELAHCPNVGEIVGLDPSPVFLAKARELAAGIPKLRFHPQRVSPARTLISVRLEGARGTCGTPGRDGYPLRCPLLIGLRPTAARQQP